jgi:hypothetical protein
MRNLRVLKKKNKRDGLFGCGNRATGRFSRCPCRSMQYRALHQMLHFYNTVGSREHPGTGRLACFSQY